MSVSSTCPRFCPCLLTCLLLLIGKKWELRERLPPTDLTILGPHTVLGRHPVLFIVSQMFVLVTNKPISFCYLVGKSSIAHRGLCSFLFLSILFSFSKVKNVTGCVSLNMTEMIILNSVLKSVFLTHWLCFSVFLCCSHFGQDSLCSPSDILQLNLSVKRTVETLLSLGAHSEESSFVSLSIQLLGFVAFYCTLMLTLCMLYYWIFPL